MNIQKKDLDKGQVELIITLTQEDLKPYMAKAAKKISLKHKIKGFRPGKATPEVVAQEFGEMALLQEAAYKALDKHVFEAINEQNLDAVGQPQVDITKMAPGNDLEAKVIVDLMPEVTLGDWKKISVKLKKEKASDEKINKVIDELRTMQAKQVIKDGAVEKGDKAVIDLEVYVDKVIQEDGNAKAFEVVIGDNKMIPGFEEQLIGLKTGDKKEFDLSFPKDYFKKSLAGKKATFKIEVKSIFAIEKPEKNDELAQMLNFKTWKELEKQITDNVTQEVEQENMHKAEVDMFEKLIDQTKYSTIPEGMIDGEKNKMMYELQQNINQQGMRVEDYLSHMNTTEEQIKEGFTEDAIKRIKTSLVIREIGTTEKIEATDNEIEEELQGTLDRYKDQAPDIKKQIDTPQYRSYLKGHITTRKVVEMLRNQIIEGVESKEEKKA